MSAKTVTKGILSIATWNTAKIVASALSAPILARLLGADGYGQYAYYLAILLLAYPFANLGTAATLTKNIAERPDDLIWRNHLVALAGLVNILGVLAVGTIVSIFIVIHNPAGSQSALIAGIIVGAILCEQVWFFARSILYGIHQEPLAMLPATLGTLMAAAIGVGLAASGLGLIGVLSGILIANFGVAIVTFKYASQFLQFRWRLDLPGFLPVGQILRFGFSSMFFNIFSLVLYRVDAILLPHLADNRQAGWYAAAVQWSEFVWFVPLAVQAVMLQSTSQLWANNRTDEITSLLSRLLRYVALGTAFFLLFVVVLADQILSIYFGPDFVAASSALRILALGVFSFSLAQVTGSVIQARGNVLPLIVVIALAALANLGLNWFLLPVWGAVGAAVAGCISYGGVVLAYERIIRAYGVHPFRGLQIGRLLLLCGVTAMMLALVAILIPTALIALIVGGVLALCVYWAGALWLGLINVQEIGQIIDTLPNPLRKHGIGVFQALQPLLLRIEVGPIGKI